MNMNEIERYESDIVIIGSEGAGSTAAIEAARRGYSVLVLTKGNGLGRSGATITGEADLAVDSKSLAERFGLQGADAADSKETFFKDILLGGKFLNQQDLVEIHVEDAPERLKDLLDWGLNPMFVAKMSGHSFPRGVMVSAPQMIRIYRKKVKESGVKVMSNVMIQDLLTNDEHCAGVFGLNITTGRFLTVKSRAVLLATGGGMRLYPLTTGPEELTGDGTAMALRAGVELMDMEFPMFLPGCFPWPPAVKGVNTPFKLSSAGMVNGHLLNKHGERFMAKWDPAKMEHSTRDILSVGIWNEIMEGRGGPHGGVFVSLKHLPSNLIDYMFDWLPPKYLKKFGGFDMTKFIPDLTQEGVESVPACHFFNGGVKIDIHCRTNLPGLYAAGEVVAGIHGSNRLSGNAFTDMIVWGHRAAVGMDEYLRQQKNRVEIDEAQVARYAVAASAGLDAQGGEPVQTVRDAALSIAWEHAGIVRNRDLLTAGKEKVQSLKQQYRNVSVRCKERIYNKEWVRYLETGNMIANLECIISAALERQESRGAHYRKDYPQTDNKAWLVNQILRMEEGSIRIDRIAPTITKIVPPTVVEKYGA